MMTKFSHILFTVGGLWLFAYFIQENFPYKFIAIFGLIVSAIMIGIDKDLKSHLTGKIKNHAAFVVSMIFGFSLGITSAIVLRNLSALSNLPKLFSNFVWIAMLIGVTEELIFRGWLFSAIADRFNFFAIIFSAAVHSVFKILIFLSPASKFEVDAVNLFNYTFLAGIILGLLRKWSGSIWPAAMAHVVFDVMVYGDVLAWPWWVF